MSTEKDEWQNKINEENRLREEKEYQWYSSLGQDISLTERQFENIAEESEKRYLQALKQNKAGYCTLYDFYWSDINAAARSVNPGEWFKVWHCHYPCLINKWGHSIAWMRKADYYVNKALACGIAETAEEAVEYFKEKA